MFTGIIETLGVIADIKDINGNRHFWIESPITGELKVDQSVSHNGVCLTVTNIKDRQYEVVAIEETLFRTNLGNCRIGDELNLERCLSMNGRLDGHMVQGHVDCCSECLERKELEGSWVFRFRLPEQYAALVVEKGSIAVNGVSLTVSALGIEDFSVSIIPFTFEHTNFNSIHSESVINLEFDILGKYVRRQLELKYKA